MPDIIFHIGMAKCASTTLQNIVFSQMPGYLGTGKKIPRGENFAKTFQTFSPVGPRLRGSLAAAESWSKSVLAYRERTWPKVQRLIVSTEFLTNRNRFHSRPIVPFLERFSKVIWDNGAVKAIIVLRNPAERMASNYAQSSSVIFGASQADFETRIDHILTRDREILDVGSWVDDLYRALGRDNVCVLLMEDIGELRFWQELKSFADLEPFDPSSMLTRDGMNQRKLASNTWHLSKFNRKNLAKSQAGKLVGLIWPGGRLPGFRQKSALLLTHGLSAMQALNPS